MGTLTKIVLLTLGVTALVFVIIHLATRAMGRAKGRSSGAGAAGWALLFLSSGRMPPPPPASQIELDVAAKKDRSAADDSKLEPRS